MSFLLLASFFSDSRVCNQLYDILAKQKLFRRALKFESTTQKVEKNGEEGADPEFSLSYPYEGYFRFTLFNLKAFLVVFLFTRECWSNFLRLHNNNGNRIPFFDVKKKRDTTCKRVPSNYELEKRCLLRERERVGEEREKDRRIDKKAIVNKAR